MPHSNGQVVQAGRWLYWVAALSVVNFVLILVGSEWGLALSMGFTDLVAMLTNEVEGIAKPIVMAFAGVVILGIAGLGWQACEGKLWAFVVGIVVILLDTLILLPYGVDGLISIGFHLYATWCLFTGIRALKSTNAAPPV